MLHLFHRSQPKLKPSTNPLSFGPPILNAFAKVAEILRRTIHPPPVPAVPIVKPPRVPLVSPPRVPTSNAQILHFAQSIQHDPSVAGKMFNPTTGRAETIDSLIRGPDKDIWITSLANEWGRCAQGIAKNRPLSHQVTGNRTIFFIRPSQVPAGRKVTYANFVCTMND